MVPILYCFAFGQGRLYYPTIILTIITLRVINGVMVYSSDLMQLWLSPMANEERRSFREVNAVVACTGEAWSTLLERSL